MNQDAPNVFSGLMQNRHAAQAGRFLRMTAYRYVENDRSRDCCSLAMTTLHGVSAGPRHPVVWC